MCPAKAGLSDNRSPAVSTGENFLEIQPGLAVCLSTSADLNAVHTQASFPGDNQYIHVNCLLQGRFEARVKDVALQCAAGDISMGFSDGEMFHTRHCHEFCHLALMLTPEVMNSLAGEALSGLNVDQALAFFIKSGRADQRVTLSANQVVSLMKQGSDKHLLLHSAVLDFLYWHLKAIENHSADEQVSVRERRQLNAAKDYLLHDLSAPPTIAQLASAVGLNQCKLKKGFKHLFGTSIYARFQEERMQKAMNLLKTNNVTETAMLLGYSNVSHFSNAFRKQFGLLPRDARRELEPNV